MKKLLPNSKPSGFTLIELLVVVSIIAILAVIGMVMLGGLQGRARDAERRAEVDAILKAYEIKHNAATGTYPASVAPEDFADGEIPTPPNYDPADSTTGYDVDVGSGNKTIKVCATLENGTPYCKSGAQAVPSSPSPSASPT